MIFDERGEVDLEWSLATCTRTYGFVHIISIAAAATTLVLMAWTTRTGTSSTSFKFYSSRCEDEERNDGSMVS